MSQFRIDPKYLRQKPQSIGDFNGVPQGIGNPGYNINQDEIGLSITSLLGFQALSLLESKAFSRIFGTGVKVAELNQKKSQENKRSSQFKSEDAFDHVRPDANPDGSGGFEKTEGWGGYMSSSLNGMPVMCRLKFIGTTYTALDGSQVTIPDIIFETVVITLKMSKNIEKTLITGRNTGTVKEYISQGDWNVEIRAITTASAPVNNDIFARVQDGVYPIENMEDIMILLNAPIAIKVECWFLNKIAGINYLVIDDGACIDQVEGEYEMQRLVIPALSDNPLIITVEG